VPTAVPATDTTAPPTSPPTTSPTTADGLPLRQLGRIDWLASAITIGGAELRDSKVVSYAVERGVNVLDTAPSYGTSHETIKPVLADHRDDVFLLSKVRERQGRQIDQALRSSLQRMGVDTIDIVLLHDIDGPAALDRATAADGALGALEAARKAGVIRHIGLSGHVRSDVLMMAFDRFDFDLVLCPVNPMDAVIDDFVSTAAAAANRRGAAVIGMKVMAAGRVPDPARALRWALSQPMHTLTLGMRSKAEVDLDIATAIEWHRNPPTPEELNGLVEEWRPLAVRSNFYWRS
jgi:predicted aldo/keto reductase-like oxidoreductase